MISICRNPALRVNGSLAWIMLEGYICFRMTMQTDCMIRREHRKMPGRGRPIIQRNQVSFSTTVQDTRPSDSQ